MARKIDPDQREQHKAAIAEAVWRLVARSGLEAVSLREVAGEAGVSVGRVQHYFGTKDALLLYGLRLAQQRMEGRIRRRIAGLVAPGAEDVLRATLAELLGDDPDTRQAVRVWTAFLGRALDDRAIAEALFADDVELRAFTTEVVGSPLDAHGLWALANGLAAEVACGQTTAADARAVVDHHLDRLLGSPDR
ncbi:TetR family transcriptional regulator [Saccharothrix sp.]|uniref:TetR/AcrR family transcriptional regulator n=1 Tax=Saccharothrix sp. TaxID=1873460 RepID=UPI002810E180|nr:TetR family transcriptional regulator C-terminal domain-containing protein [Saccharothrix sp.]